METTDFLGIGNPKLLGLWIGDSTHGSLQARRLSVGRMLDRGLTAGKNICASIQTWKMCGVALGRQYALYNFMIELLEIKKLLIVLNTC